MSDADLNETLLFFTVQRRPELVQAMEEALVDPNGCDDYENFHEQLVRLETLFRNTFEGQFHLATISVAACVTARIKQLNPNFTAVQVLNEALTNWYQPALRYLITKKLID